MPICNEVLRINKEKKKKETVRAGLTSISGMGLITIQTLAGIGLMTQENIDPLDERGWLLIGAFGITMGAYMVSQGVKKAYTNMKEMMRGDYSIRESFYESDGATLPRSYKDQFK